MPEGTDNGQVQTGADGAAATQVTPTEQQVQNMTGMALAFDEPNLIPNAGNTENNGDGTGASQEGSGDTTTTQTQAPVFEFKTFTEKYGWQTPEDATKEIEELRVLKANPVKEEIKYENEESKKLHQLIVSGKTKEAFQILETQEKIESLTTADVSGDNAGDIIKLSMQLKYKDAGLTSKEIDYKYNKQYALPKQPVLDTEDEDSVRVHNEWKENVDDINTGKIIDAKAAKIELQAAKTKLVLPDIEQNVDVDYEAYKAREAKANKAYEDVVIPAVNALKETDVQLGFKVEDANNQMNFEISLVPTKDDFEKARQDSLSIPEFLAKTCYDQNGKFYPEKLQRMVLLEQNFDNYAQSIARQAVNEERKRVVAKEAPNNGNAGKDFNVNTEKTELQKNMEFALS